MKEEDTRKKEGKNDEVIEGRYMNRRGGEGRRGREDKEGKREGGWRRNKRKKR